VGRNEGGDTLPDFKSFSKKRGSGPPAGPGRNTEPKGKKKKKSFGEEKNPTPSKSEKRGAEKGGTEEVEGKKNLSFTGRQEEGDLGDDFP